MAVVPRQIRMGSVQLCVMTSPPLAIISVSAWKVTIDSG